MIVNESSNLYRNELRNKCDKTIMQYLLWSLLTMVIFLFFYQMSLESNSSRISTCSEGKTYTNSAKFHFYPPVTGELNCEFTIDYIFSDRQATVIHCKGKVS